MRLPHPADTFKYVTTGIILHHPYLACKGLASVAPGSLANGLSQDIVPSHNVVVFINASFESYKIK